MRNVVVVLFSYLLTVLAVGSSNNKTAFAAPPGPDAKVTQVEASDPINWENFEDPEAILYFTQQIEKKIEKLSAAEKDAAVRRLQKSLKADSMEIRRRAALTLGALGDKSGVPTMIADLPKSTGHDRDNVIVALRVLKDERAIPALTKALKVKSPYVRSIALAALGELKATAAFDQIVALTKDKETRYLDEPEKEKMLDCMPIVPAESACYALGALGDERAIPILIELLDDQELLQPVSKALEALTKQKFGKDVAAWKSWWKDNH